MLEISSCDNNTTLFLARNNVYRISQSYNQSDLLNIIKILQNNFPEIIGTKINTHPLDPEIQFALNLSYKDPLILIHPRIDFISYPHEWPIKMLRDAGIFHIKLCQKLVKSNLFLKDSHPWNILFSNSKFIFVDYFSILTKNALFEEEFLNPKKENNYLENKSNKNLAKLILRVFNSMFLPYFISPIILNQLIDSNNVRKILFSNALNTSKQSINLRIFFKYKFFSLKFLTNLPSVLKNKFFIYVIFSRFRINHNLNQFWDSLIIFLENLPDKPTTSSYLKYYENKNGDMALGKKEDWDKKQISVYDALNSDKISTVIDLASNTGWYAIMAESLGKNVIAVDIDGECITDLYKKTIEANLNILPLVMDIRDLHRSKTSIYDGKQVLLPATERLRCDAALALGIIHHLVLGLGLELHVALQMISKFSRKSIVLEFVDLIDPMIQNEVDFFPALKKNPALRNKYNLENIIDFFSKEYSHSICQSDNPTRKILIFTKRNVS